MEATVVTPYDISGRLWLRVGRYRGFVLSARPFVIGRLGATTVRAHPSLLLAGVVLVMLFAPRFDAGGANPYLVGVVFVVALYASVLVHELAHMAVALAYGLRVPSVTLHLLGGETRIAGGSRGPLQEALTSVVGPLASASVGLVASVGVGAVQDPTAAQVLWSLGWINLLIAGFNLLPAPPLDGGHVVAAIVWGISGRPSSGTRASGWSGRATAVLAVVVVVWFSLGSSRGLVDVLVAVIVAGFLWTSAGQALRLATLQRRHEDADDEPHPGSGRTTP